MYHVSAQGVDERMINVDYYYHYYSQRLRESYRAHGEVLSPHCGRDCKWIEKCT